MRQPSQADAFFIYAKKNLPNLAVRQTRHKQLYY